MKVESWWNSQRAHTTTVQTVVLITCFYTSSWHAIHLQGWTALMKAASGGHVNVAQLLVTAGVDVNARDNSVRTLLLVGL